MGLQRYTVRLARQDCAHHPWEDRPITGLDAGVNPADAGLLSPPIGTFDPSQRQSTSLKVSMPPS